MPFYYINTFIYCKPLNRRLSVFENITCDYYRDNLNGIFNSSTSTISNDEEIDFSKKQNKDFNLEELKVVF